MSDLSGSETTLPTAEAKWTYAAQLKVSPQQLAPSPIAALTKALSTAQDDGDRLTARTGLPSTRSLPLAYSHLSVRGTGGAGVMTIPTIGTWTKKAPKAAPKPAEAALPGAKDLQPSERCADSGI